MSIRTIVTYPNRILKEKSVKVTKFHAQLHKLLDDMVDTMISAKGIGLAAPQVGILKQVFVVNIGTGLYEVVNPEVIEESLEQVVSPEGCLSIPNVVGDVRRFKTIKVRGQDRFGEPIEIEVDDYLARAFQHEIDHLNGVLFIDRAENLYRTVEN